MQIVKNGLSICLIAILAFVSLITLPANSQPAGDDSTHPFRLKRPGENDQASPAAGQPDTPLQGNVTRVGILDEPDASSSALSQFDWRQAFPSIGIHQTPLTGHIEGEGFLNTQPVTAAAKAIFAPPPMYRAWLEKTYPQFSLQTAAMANNRLVVVFDKYDDTGRTLSSLGLQFTTIDKKQLDFYNLDGVQVLVIDCGPTNMSLQAMMKVRDFVARGGYLFTTDWMLDKLDQLIFPGFIAWNGAMNSQKIYDATIAGENPVLFRNVVSNAHWKMDIHCHLIRVLNKDAVHVLAVSHMLVPDDPDRQGILAVVFPFERGYVMHMTAHFDRSQQIIGYILPDPAPIIGISLRQAIAINFVVSGLTGTKPLGN